MQQGTKFSSDPLEARTTTYSDVLGRKRIAAGVRMIPISQNHVYDAYGNLTSLQDALGRVTSFTYDSTYLTYRTSVTKTAGSVALTTSQTHDAEGRVLTATDANGHTTLYSYDEFGRPKQTTFANEGSRSYEYSPLGDPTTQFRRITTTLDFGPPAAAVVQTDYFDR